MGPDAYRPPDAGVLWRVHQFGQHATPAGRPYWWENARREPRDVVVLQATLAGRITLRDPAGEHPIRPGDLALFAYGEDSAYGDPRGLAEPYACVWVGLQGAGVAEHLRAFRQRHGPVRPLGLDHPFLADLRALAAAAEPRAGTPPHALAAQAYALVMSLFADAERDRLRTLSPAEQAVDHILRQPHLPASVDEVAERFGCSREHLSRLFQARVGQSPAAYLADAKRRRALRLLRETDLPLAAVARQAGYATTHTLARHVRAHTGHSPTRFRARRDRP